MNKNGWKLGLKDMGGGKFGLPRPLHACGFNLLLVIVIALGVSPQVLLFFNIKWVGFCS